MHTEKHFDLQTLVNRAGTGNLKEVLTPEELKREGILALNAAEMDFRTAPSVIEAMISCAREGLMGFTLCDEPYRAAVCDWMRRVRGQEIEADWIVPTMGTIFSVATCIRMCVGAGQRIIVQPPTYNRYEQAADRIGRETVHNPLLRRADGSYMMDLADLERKMADPDNRLLVLCNPQNPTGTVWPREILEEVARLAVRYGVVVYSDEIFADYAFEEAGVPMFCTLLGGRNNGISATSLGKTFSFTGVNHANILIADEALRERFTKQKYSDHYGSLEPMHRAAILGAYSDEGLAWKRAVQELLERNYRRVRDFFREKLPEVIVSPLQGGYVLWLDWGALPQGKAQELMARAKLVLEDGENFGCVPNRYSRMCIATPESVLDGALARLAEALESV